MNTRALSVLTSIAAVLGLSLKTVQNHVSRILDKLQAADRTQAALRARGLMRPR
jgi:DNA-binding NarL/FixJ family response regulator